MKYFLLIYLLIFIYILLILIFLISTLNPIIKELEGITLVQKEEIIQEDKCFIFHKDGEIVRGDKFWTVLRQEEVDCIENSGD